MFRLTFTTVLMGFLLLFLSPQLLLFALLGFFYTTIVTCPSFTGILLSLLMLSLCYIVGESRFLWLLPNLVLLPQLTKTKIRHCFTPHSLLVLTIGFIPNLFYVLTGRTSYFERLRRKIEQAFTVVWLLLLSAIPVVYSLSDDVVSEHLFFWYCLCTLYTVAIIFSLLRRQSMKALAQALAGRLCRSSSLGKGEALLAEVFPEESALVPLLEETIALIVSFTVCFLVIAVYTLPLFLLYVNIVAS